MQKNVLEYFEKTVLQHRNKTAVQDGNMDVTFGELEGYAKAMGTLIGARGCGKKIPIAVFLPKSTGSLISFLGILYSGNIYVPLDINSPDARIKDILEDLDHPPVISREDFRDRLVSMGVEPGSILCLEEVLSRKAGYDNETLMRNLESLIDMDPAYIIYTSGSTGKPKGVVVSHRGIIDYIDWAMECFHIDQSTVIGNQSPFYFDNSTLDIYLSLAAGATLVIIPEQYFAYPVKLLEFVTDRNINFIFWVPSVMIHVANTRALDVINPACLQKVLFAGEVMPNKHLNYWRKKLPHALFANLYGPTEITVDCTYYIVDREFKDDEPLPIGFPCRNTDILILTEENREAVGQEMGELCVRGTSLALGYWRDFAKSQEVFVQNPLTPHYYDRIYRTGDLVYRNRYGEIIFVGRKDSQIKHMGYRIELGEIENAVLSLAGIHNACVLYNTVAREITLFYQGDENLTAKSIRQGLLSILPKYMIPTRFQRMEKLPLNSNGKIDRRGLAAQWFGNM